MNAQQFLRLKAEPAATNLPLPSREFLCRIALVAIFAAAAHLFPWTWLRFLTSESILRISASLGMPGARVSFDTLYLNGQLNQFVIACTFADVYLGAIPLLWDLKKNLLRNISWLTAVAIIFFGFNLVRLEIAQTLYTHGVSWEFADGVCGGVAYFAVWLFIWRHRSWELTSASANPALRNHSAAPT